MKRDLIPVTIMGKRLWLIQRPHPTTPPDTPSKDDLSKHPPHCYHTQPPTWAPRHVKRPVGRVAGWVFAHNVPSCRADVPADGARVLASTQQQAGVVGRPGHPQHTLWSKGRAGATSAGSQLSRWCARPCQRSAASWGRGVARPCLAHPVEVEMGGEGQRWAAIRTAHVCARPPHSRGSLPSPSGTDAHLGVPHKLLERRHAVAQVPHLQRRRAVVV